jgi:nitronate monooxygenase
LKPSRQSEEAAILGNYCEVWLAKHNDDGSPTDGLVGINLLTKVALPTIHSLYGAMLAGVDYVIMGAGIPAKIPGILDALAEGLDCSLPIDVSGADNEESFSMTFSPKMFWKGSGTRHLVEEPLKRPAFLPIVSSTTLAQSLLKRSNGKGPTRGIDGFVVELNTAGGHNAPPRGWHFQAKDVNEPVYGDKDMVAVNAFAKVSKGLPFWFAGSYGKREKLGEVIKNGGTGVQVSVIQLSSYFHFVLLVYLIDQLIFYKVGTLFALAQESGMEPAIKQRILDELANGHELNVFTDPAASPTGFPFKVLELDGGSIHTLSDCEVYSTRPRVCNLGYLRSPYLKPNGDVGYRCPAEPVSDFVAKGGDVDATVGRKCLCNALCADAGFPQVRLLTNQDTGKRELYTEPGLVTTGNDINECKYLMKPNEDGTWGYSANDVVDYLLSDPSCENKDVAYSKQQPVS